MKTGEKKEAKLLDEEETFLFLYSCSIYIHIQHGGRGKSTFNIQWTEHNVKKCQVVEMITVQLAGGDEIF